MKKYFFGFAALLIAATMVFAFTTNSPKAIVAKEAKFATVIYEYTPALGVPNPPTTKAQVTSSSNWTLRTVAPSCDGLSSKFCRIQFDNLNTSFADAVDIIGNRIQNGQPIVHGATYTVGTKSVTIFLKS